MTNRLLEKAQVKDDQICRHQPSSVSVFIDCEPYPEQPPHELQKKYLLQLVTQVEFWANPAEYDRAKECAELNLMELIYGDIRSMFHRLRLEIHNGNRDEAMRLLHNMEELMK